MDNSPLTDKEVMLFMSKVLKGEILEFLLPKPVADVVNAYKVVYAIDKNYWEQVKTTFLSSKETFDSTLKGFLKGDELGKVVFMLPFSVTKAERYQIHKYSKKNLVSALSADYNDKRIMKIVLEEPFVQMLLK